MLTVTAVHLQLQRKCALLSFSHSDEHKLSADLVLMVSGKVVDNGTNAWAPATNTDTWIEF